MPCGASEGIAAIGHGPDHTLKLTPPSHAAGWPGRRLQRALPSLVEMRSAWPGLGAPPDRVVREDPVKRQDGRGENPTSCVARRPLQTSVGVAGATWRRGANCENPRSTRFADSGSHLAPASVTRPSTWNAFRPRRSPSVGSLGNVSPGRESLELLHHALCVGYRKLLLVHRRPGHPCHAENSVPTGLGRQIRMTDSARSNGAGTGALRVSRSSLNK